jgi:Ca2+-binding EF-hand superfamily protein
MNTHPIKTALALSGLMLAASAPVFGSEAEDMFKRMDADGNGKVTAVEHAQFAENKFKQSDTNYDGQVSAAECNAAEAAYHKKDRFDEKATAAHIRLVDTDGNGQISSSENSMFARNAFAKADKNGDQVLSEDEVEKAHKEMKKEAKELRKD